MGKTTIQLTEATKTLLDGHKQGQESYNDVVRRLAGDSPGQLWTEQEIQGLIQQELETLHR